MQISRRPEGGELRRALIGKISAGTTGTRIAQEAGVSVRAVQQIVNEGHKGRSASTPLTWKKLRGHTEAAARLALYVGLSPIDALSDLGIPVEDPRVLGLIKQIERARLLDRGVTDRVLDRIIDRGEIRPAVILWEPFTSPPQSVNPPQQDVSNLSRLAADSWAGSYLKLLLGTVNPSLPKKLQGVSTIHAALELLLRRPDQCDLVFGIYETSYRHTLGLSFVPVPGLAAPLGALSTADDISWKNLSSPTKPIRAFVMRDEVGHLFMTGVCDYSEKSRDKELIVLGEDRDKALLEILNDLDQASAIADSRARVVVADNNTCQYLMSHLVTADWLEQMGITNAENQSRLRQSKASLRIALKKEHAPTYPIGIAVRGDSIRWQTLLKTATQEMFRNARYLVSQSFIHLLRDRKGTDILRPVPLEPMLSSFEAHEFVKQTQEAWGDIPPDWKLTWLSQPACA